MDPDGSKVKCVVIKFLHNGKYLRYMREPPEIAPSARELFKDMIHGSGHDPASPCARFYAEPSKSHNGFYHIRCSYNDKYMVPKKVEGRVYLFCNAEEPQDDISQSSCTLLRLPSFGNNSYLASGEGIFFVIPDTHPTISNLRGCLTLPYQESKQFPYSNDEYREMHIIELVQPLVLPKQVCFKGDNGKYLTFSKESVWMLLSQETIFQLFKERKVLATFSASDIGDPSVLVGVIQTLEDGRIGFQNGRTGRYLWVDHDQGDINLIRPDSKTINSADPNFWFRMVKLGNKKIALQHVSSRRFCKRLSIGLGLPDHLFVAKEETISEFAQLELEEPVRSREIYNVKYDMANAKFYDKKVVTLTTAQAENHGSAENTAKLSKKYSVTKQTTWDLSNTVTTGVSFTIKAGVPKIKAEADLQVHKETTETRSWGESKTETDEQSIDYEIKTPPKTKVTLKLMASESTFEVPFSYSQKDVLTDGTQVEYHQLENGVYRGVNNYDLRYELNEESLEHSDKAKKTSS